MAEKKKEETDEVAAQQREMIPTPEQKEEQYSAQEGEEHVVANDGSNWTTPPSPVDLEEKIEADKKVAEKAAKGSGPSATNETPSR